MAAGTVFETKPYDEALEPLDTWEGMSVIQPDRREPLHECVRIAVRYYLERMDGHDVEGLYRIVLDQVERPLIETVLESANHNQSVAARMLGISRSTLRKKLKRAEPS